MIRTFKIALCCLLPWMGTQAQTNCTDESMAKIPWKWESITTTFGGDGRTQAEMAAERATLNKVIDAVRKPFSWSPVGGKAYNRQAELTNGNIPDASLPYEMWKYLDQYRADIGFDLPLCNSAGLYFNGVIPVDMIFLFNSYYLPEGHWDKFKLSEKEGDELAYISTPLLPCDKGNYCEWLDEDRHAICRLIFKPGKNPLVTMTKKEFYEHMIRQYQMDFVSEKTGMAEMDKMNKELNDINRGIIAKIQDVLKNHTAAELAKPAFLEERSGDYYANVEDLPEEKRLYILMVNKAYFNLKLPKSAPQFATILFVDDSEFWKEDHPLQYENHRAFRKELDRIQAFDKATEAISALLQN